MEHTIWCEVQFLADEQRTPGMRSCLNDVHTLYTASGPSARTVCIKQSSGFLYNFPVAFFNVSGMGEPADGFSVVFPR